MSEEPTNVEKIQKLPWSIASNAFTSVFGQLTFFGSVFVLFLSELGLKKSQIGFLLSLLTFLGILALFVAPTIARYGFKRTYLTFFTFRKFFTAFLLFTPWVLNRYGTQATLIYVAIVLVLFGICRVIGVTAIYPWIQEYVPRSVRGKYSAFDNIFTTLTGLMAVSLAGYMLKRYTGLDGFVILFGIGIVFGVFAILLATRIPGGAAETTPNGSNQGYRALAEPFRDTNFRRYLLGASLITLAIVPLGSFLPLFMQEEVGISTGNVVWLQTGTMLGGLATTFMWGWTADRYGSKPVMISSVIVLTFLPLFWLFMPKNDPSSFSIALGITFLQGIANMGWVIGSGRLLFVNVVPPAQKTAYMSLYYAWLEVVNGISKLGGGQIVEASAGLRGQFLFFTLDPYSILFFLGIIFPLFSLLLFSGIRTDNEVSVGQFVGLFVRGNPFVAVRSLIGYHLAQDEETAVSMTERLGRARSPLTVDELLEALEDPRFNVRFEAIISMSHMKPDPRLTEALVNTLNGSELSLSVIAAWALGRLGDEEGLEALRQNSTSEYRSIRAHSIRSLGTLKDHESEQTLLAKLEVETDKGLQMAYASALGKMGSTPALDQLLQVFLKMENEGARMELTLALVRIFGNEGNFIRMVRRVRAEPGTATAQAVSSFKRKTNKWTAEVDGLAEGLEACINGLARGDLEQGVQALGQVIGLLPETRFDPMAVTVLHECEKRLDEFGADRIEYIILALHAMNEGLTAESGRPNRKRNGRASAR